MAAPAPRKTWTIVPNVTVAATYPALMTAWHTMLLALGCTIAGAWNGDDWLVEWGAESSHMGETDWAAVWGAHAHAWAVYNMPGGGQLLIDLASAANTNAGVWISPSGAFAGGYHDSRPTAADEWRYDSVDYGPWIVTSKAGPYRLHGWVNTAGSIRIVAYAESWANVVAWVFRWDVPRNPASWWSDPVVVRRVRTTTNVNYGLWESLMGNRTTTSYENGGCRGYIQGAVRNPLSFTCQSWRSQTNDSVVTPGLDAIDAAEPVTALWQIFPIGLAYGAVGGDNWHVGEIEDSYWCPADAGWVDGDIAPSATDARAWIKIGDEFWPWGLAADLDTGTATTPASRDVTLVGVLGADDAPETTAPAIANLTPTPGTLQADGFIECDVYDVGDGLELVAVWVTLSDETDPVPVYLRSAFTGRFAARSTITGAGTLASPYHLRFAPSDMWADGTTITLEIDAIDAAGNHTELTA